MKYTIICNVCTPDKVYPLMLEVEEWEVSKVYITKDEGGEFILRVKTEKWD